MFCTHYGSSKILPGCCIHLQFDPFQWEIVFHGMDVTQFVSPLPHWRISVLFLVLGVLLVRFLETFLYECVSILPFLCEQCLHFFGIDVQECSLPGSMESYMFTFLLFLRICQCFSEKLCHLTFPLTLCEWSSFSAACQYLVLSLTLH